MEKLIQPIRQMKPRYITLITFGGLFAFFALTLMRFPAPWYDEPLYISRAWVSLHPEEAYDLWAAGAFDRFEGYWVILSWLVNAFVIAGLAVAGSPSLIAARVVSLIWGFGLLAACYWIGKKLGGRQLAMITVILVACTRAFLITAHMARPDIIGAAFGYIALALYLNNVHSRGWISALTGLLAIMAFEIHANGAFFTPVIFLLFLADHGWQAFKLRTFWFFILGCLAGGAVYLVTHVLLYPETYRAIMVSVYAEAYRPPVLMLSLKELWQGLAYYGQFFLQRYVILIPVLILSLVKLLKRSAPTDKTLLVLVGAILLGYAWWVRWKFVFYEIYFVPALQIMLAGYLLDFIRRPRENTLAFRSSFVFVWTAYLSISLVNIAPAILNNLYPEYERVQRRVNQAIQPGDRILASNVYWLGLTDHPYYSIDQISFDRWFDPTSTLEKFLNRTRPDIFIYDEQARLYTTDDASGWPYGGYIYIPQTELENFLAKRAAVIDTFNGAYGFTEIYRINWDDEGAD